MCTTFMSNGRPAFILDVGVHEYDTNHNETYYQSVPDYGFDETAEFDERSGRRTADEE